MDSATTRSSEVVVQTLSIDTISFTRVAAALSTIRCPVHHHGVSLIRSALVGAGTDLRRMLLQVAVCCEEVTPLLDRALDPPG